MFCANILNRLPLIGVEVEHLAQEVEADGVGVGVEALETLLGAFGQGLDVLDGGLVADVGHVLRGGGAEHGDDALDLVEVVLAGEERGAAEQLGEDAAHGPDVHGLGVLGGVQNDLRRAVPARDHVPFIWKVLGLQLVLLLVAAREAQVADLQVAALVQQ